MGGLEVLPVAEAAGGVGDPLDLRVEALGRRVRDAVAQVRENVREVRLQSSACAPSRSSAPSGSAWPRSTSGERSKEAAGGSNVAVVPEVRAHLFQRSGDSERAVA